MECLICQVHVHAHETCGKVTGMGMCVCAGCEGDSWGEDTTRISSLFFSDFVLYRISFSVGKVICMITCRETVEGLRLFGYLQIFDTVCLINGALFAQIIKTLQEIKTGLCALRPYLSVFTTARKL